MLRDMFLGAIIILLPFICVELGSISAELHSLVDLIVG